MKKNPVGWFEIIVTDSGDLSVELGRVEQAGGKIIIPRTLISEETGFMAVIIDTEGNRIALHSHK
jgi:uncharacterized protein